MSIGPWQVLLILVVILVLFGAGKLPNVMKDLAKGINAFKKGLNEEEDDDKKKKGTPKKLEDQNEGSSQEDK